MVRLAKLYAAITIPRAMIDKHRQGRDVTYTAENCTVDIDGYWIDEKELQVLNQAGKVWVPLKTHAFDLTIKISRDKSRGKIIRNK